jgi:dTDP-glucose 4,6-dehydratase
MKLLITGGAGFIGGNFIHYMTRKYPRYEIHCLDKLTYAANVDTLAGVMNRIEFMKGDIADRKLVFDLFKANRFDIIVNFAAESHVDRSIASTEVFITTNVSGTAVLLDACKEYGVEKYHQISTDEVYGDSPIEHKDLLFTEKTPLKPSNPYSASKASADMLVMAYHRTFNLPVSISRSSNNYGPYQHPEKLIPRMTINALIGKPLTVYGNGGHIREWLHVTDHCRAIDAIVHKARAGGIYNIGSRQERANLDVIKAITAELGKDDSLIKFVADRPGHDLRYGIDFTKIKDELGWEPEIGFETGLKDTIQWYTENQSWWEKLV